MPLKDILYNSFSKVNDKRRKEPMSEPISAYKPKETQIFQSILLNVILTLNTAFKKCTIAVENMANSIGKKKPKTTSKIVPKPNPEKKVNREALKALIQSRK